MNRATITLLTTVSAFAVTCQNETSVAQSPHAPPACRYVRPTDLAAGTTVWIGGCVDGRADGPGVLRVTTAGGPRFFFGTMRAGQPQRGVVTQDNNDDVIAWRFEGASAVEPTDRKQTSEIYTAASAGAAAAAAVFRTSGNAASAKYYARWSSTLASALDQGE